MVFPPFIVMEIFFQRLTSLRIEMRIHRNYLQVSSHLSMNRLVGNVWILLVPRALIIFASMAFPILKTHPAEIELARETLHLCEKFV